MTGRSTERPTSSISRLPAPARAERERQRREQRERHGEARQVRLHDLIPQSVCRNPVGPATGRSPFAWAGDPWLCVPASRRVCPGRTLGTERSSSASDTLRSRAREANMSFVLLDGRTGEVPRRTIGSRADTHGGRVSSGVTRGEAAARDRLVRRAGGPPAAVGPRRAPASRRHAECQSWPQRWPAARTSARQARVARAPRISRTRDRCRRMITSARTRGTRIPTGSLRPASGPCRR